MMISLIIKLQLLQVETLWYIDTITKTRCNSTKNKMKKHITQNTHKNILKHKYFFEYSKYNVLSIVIWKKVQAMVDSYKGANADISQLCKSITELLLVHIDSRRVYENLEFEEDQVIIQLSFFMKRPVDCMLCIPMKL